MCMYISAQVSIHVQEARIAQLVEHPTKKLGVILMQIQVPVLQRIFLPESTSSAGSLRSLTVPLFGHTHKFYAH